MSKQYIITDPCYILSDTVWQNICKSCKDDDYYNGTFDNKVTEELNKLANTTTAKASTTGFGDWDNCIHSDNPTEANIIQPDFFADSGMVCVVEYNDNIKQALKDKDNDHLTDEDKGGAAVIEIQDDSDIDIEMDTSDTNWTQVKISTPNENFWSMYPYDSDDDDEEDEDDYDYEEDYDE